MFFFQLMLQACDDGIPQRCITEPLIINVVSDRQPPVFTPTNNYVFTMNETELVGYLIGQVTAVDFDQLVSRPDVQVHFIFHRG